MILVVSCCGTPLEGLGKIVDYMLRPVDQRVRSYIEYTPDLLRKIHELNKRGPQPKGTIIFSLDVVKMYPSIPTDTAPGWIEERCLRFRLGRDLTSWLIKVVKKMDAKREYI